ncbi:hypothetical protein TWF481_011476 [Arthrobotrys musiformis]|uniref:Aminoglycoside phosphotransferase domain-containing protein n=1 Tax=Arthrobotrys musiformis TaxID=47236 RepID=A0AAV9W1F1_9PEZI
MALHETLSDSELAQLCSRPDRNKICFNVVKISDQAVVKFGTHIRREEAENLRLARAVLDPKIVYVPQVYRTFKYERKYYIVMEYIDAIPILDSEYDDLAERVADVLKHLHSISGKIPGSLGGGISRGFLWESDFPNFRTIDQLEIWVNRRVKTHPKVSFKDRDLVLCHPDVVPRNILRKSDGSICLVDWESAGYYPRCFEAAAMRLVNTATTRFENLLLERVQSGFGAEEVQMAKSVFEAWCRSDFILFKPNELSNRESFSLFEYAKLLGLPVTGVPPKSPVIPPASSINT